ncbi:MAG TPA: response regulator [Candidatus Binataceae bacterium]|nr:response regulator [Candidatus Binataceae bacterium]
MADAVEGDDADAAHANSNPRDKMKSEGILIVDDNESNLRLMQAIVDSEGYPVKSATDAQEALEVLQTWQPKLILMDIQMPGIDGLELTRRLKRDPRYRGTVIVALTAYAMKGDEEKARDAGCDGYVTKPIDTRTLPGIIKDYLRHALNAREAPVARPQRARRNTKRSLASRD